MARAETCDGIPRPFQRRLLAAATDAGRSALARVRAIQEEGKSVYADPCGREQVSFGIALPARAGRNAALLRTSRVDLTVADICGNVRVRIGTPG